MKCKDCVCSDVCYYKAFNDVRHVKRRDDVEKICKSFVNRDAVEVVHGRWIHPKGHVVSNEFLCSECGHGETSYHAIHPLPGGGLKADESGNFFHPPKMNYCPNCGADMRERKDND